MREYKNLLFDFDGVILDSMKVRDLGFKTIFKEFESSRIDQLLEYHRKNGGLSRYHKIEYFYQKILGEEITKKQVEILANDFSKIMRQLLTDRERLIPDTVHFLRNNYQKKNLHIVSGSDERELRYLSKELGIAGYFKSIHGSPTEKLILIKLILDQENYELNQTVMIGDSMNDYEAAMANKIAFWGFNNPILKKYSSYYITSFYNL